MTSIEWLEQMAKSMVINGGDLGEDYPALLIHIQQAKEMHKQEIMNTYIIADSESTQEDSEHYALKFYERTYGSKGSGIEKEQEIEFYKRELEYERNRQEISDEEIEQQALTFAKEESYGELSTDLWKGYVFGAKRMREQLKQNL